MGSRHHRSRRRIPEPNIEYRPKALHIPRGNPPLVICPPVFEGLRRHSDMPDFDVIRFVLNQLFVRKASAAKLEALERARARPALKVPVDPGTLRRPEHLQDRALRAHTGLWANNLPIEIRPSLLLERYPHVANRVALCWADKALIDRLFEDLLIDKRGGRKGFPPPVRAELLNLRKSYPRIMQKDGAPARIHRSDFVLATPHWDPHAQATSDR